MIEIILFELIILSFFSWIEFRDMFQWLQMLASFEIVSRLTIILALHQLLIFAMVRLKFSAREDAIASKIHLINLALHINHHELDFSKLSSAVYKVAYERNEVMYSKEDIHWLKHFHEAIVTRMNTDEIELKVNFKQLLEFDKINFEHSKEMQKLDWTNSFFLDLVK